MQIHLAVGVDRRYLTPLKVALVSLADQLGPRAQPVLHLVHRSLLADDVAAIDPRFEVRPITPDAALVDRISRHPRLPPETAFPLLLPEVLRDLDRVIFLDADILVLADVTPLWELDLRGCAVAAAPDGAIQKCSDRRGLAEWKALGIPADTVYFNGGVLVMDLGAWRDRDVTERALSYLRDSAFTAEFLHQEAINAVLSDDRLLLDQRWNVLGAAARRQAERARRPWIVHFAGRIKPWLAPIGGPYEATYRELLRRLEISRPVPDRKTRARSLYDRYLRPVTYPLEHAVWSRGWL
ncbi:MAG: glycosyltransferase family 8 protein [Gaiellales bacterium]